MKKLTQKFYNEYTRLDELCQSLYDTEKGVSSYIEMMSTVFPKYSERIPLWQDDLKQLKRLRHIRNTLAHTVDAFDMDLCSREDLQWLNVFYKRLLDRKDPLAQLRQLFQNKKARRRDKNGIFKQAGH